MLLNRETASEIVRLLSEGFDLPVRIYLSLWYKPIACAYSKRLCKHFVNDVELLKKQRRTTTAAYYSIGLHTANAAYYCVETRNSILY